MSQVSLEHIRGEQLAFPVKLHNSADYKLTPANYFVVFLSFQTSHNYLNCKIWSLQLRWYVQLFKIQQGTWFINYHFTLEWKWYIVISKLIELLCRLDDLLTIKIIAKTLFLIWFFDSHLSYFIYKFWPIPLSLWSQSGSTPVVCLFVCQKCIFVDLTDNVQGDRVTLILASGCNKS